MITAMRLAPKEDAQFKVACLTCGREWDSLDDPESDNERHCGDNSALIEFADSERGRRLLAVAIRVHREMMDEES
jgi:hypothetical protein